MNQRLYERFQIQLDAKVMDITNEGQSDGGRLVDVSRGGMCVELAHPVELGNVVRVDCSEGSFFGQVMHATRNGSGFRIGIDVFNVLLGRSDLSRLIERALAQKDKVRVGCTV